MQLLEVRMGHSRGRKSQSSVQGWEITYRFVLKLSGRHPCESKADLPLALQRYFYKPVNYLNDQIMEAEHGELFQC